MAENETTKIAEHQDEEQQKTQQQQIQKYLPYQKGVSVHETPGYIKGTYRVEWTDASGVKHTGMPTKQGRVSFRGKMIEVPSGAQWVRLGGVGAEIRPESLGEKTRELLEEEGRIPPSGEYKILDYGTGEFVSVPKSIYEQREAYYTDKARFEAQLKTLPQELQETYKSRGYDAFKAAYADYAAKKLTEVTAKLETGAPEIIAETPKHWQNIRTGELLTDEQRQEEIGKDPNAPITRYYPQIADTVAEALSLGKVQTATFNKEDIADQYESQLKVTEAVFKGDYDGLTRLYQQGAFGKEGSPEAYNSYLEAWGIIGQQEAIERAVKYGDTPTLDKLYQEGAFGNDEGNYLTIRKYVEDGGRELQQPTQEDLDALKASYGTKEEYTQEVLDAQPTNIQLAKGVGIAMVPVYGTIYYWDDMSGAWKVGSIAIDALTFIPFVGGVAAAAKVSAGVGKAARLIAGAKAIPRIALAELKAPFTAIRHPLNTVKMTAGELRNLGEWLLNPRQLPLNTVATSYGTVRLDASIAGSPEAAMYIRDELMRLQSAGEKPVVIFAGKEYRLREPILMQGGGVATASPDISWVGVPGGAMVEAKLYPVGHPLAGTRLAEKEQGLFVANAALDRFTTSSAFGMEGVGTIADDGLDAIEVLTGRLTEVGKVEDVARLNKLAEEIKQAKATGNAETIGETGARAWKEIDDYLYNEFLNAYDSIAEKAQVAYRGGDTAAFEEAMTDLRTADWLLEQSKSAPGIAMFSPDFAVYAKPSGKAYYGMVFQPKPNEIWAIMEHEIAQDRAAQLLFDAANLKRGGKYIEAARLTEEAQSLIHSGKSGFKRMTTAEMELKFTEGTKLPEMKPRYFYREIGGQKLMVFTDKPWDFRKVTKAKALAPIETLKQIYSPAISVKNIPMTDAEKLAKIDKLLREADHLESIGDVTKAKILRFEADSLRQMLATAMVPEDAVRVSRTIDEVDEYTQAAQKAEALGDTISADRLMREAEAIRASRLASRMYASEAVRRAGTRMGVFQSIRVLGIRHPEYRSEQAIPIRRPLERPEEVLRMPELIRPPEPERIVERGRGEGRTPEVPRPPERPPEPPPPPPPPPPPVPEPKREPEIHLTPELKRQEEIIQNPPPGTITWIQGSPRGGDMVKILPPPYRTEDMFTTREHPYGFIDSGSNRPTDTIQVLGGLPAEDTVVRMGWAVVNIDVQGKSVFVDFDRSDLAAEQKGIRRIVPFEERIISPDKNLVPSKREIVSGHEIIKENATIKPSEAMGGIPEKTEGVSYEFRDVTAPMGKAGLPSILGESGEGEEEEEPRKKPKNLKNWWDNAFYENTPPLPSKKGKVVSGRTYYGRELLPPDLGGTL